MTALAPEHPGGAHVVYKYDLDAGVTKIDVPAPAHVLHAGWQHDGVRVWIKRPAWDMPNVATLKFLVVGTGHRVDLDGWEYLSTVLAHDGALVLHVYWDIEPED